MIQVRYWIELMIDSLLVDSVLNLTIAQELAENSEFLAGIL